jgi:hypothetical protein
MWAGKKPWPAGRHAAFAKDEFQFLQSKLKLGVFVPDAAAPGGNLFSPLAAQGGLAGANRGLAG